MLFRGLGTLVDVDGEPKGLPKIFVVPALSENNKLPFSFKTQAESL